MSIANTIRRARERQDAHNPWGVEHLPGPEEYLTQATQGIDMTAKVQTRMHKPFDPSNMEITDDPIPEGRQLPPNKYVPIFEKMKMGQALKVPGRSVGSVCTAMRKWIEEKKLDAHIKATERYKDCPDGLGRVWLQAGPQPMKPANAKKGKA